MPASRSSTTGRRNPKHRPDHGASVVVGFRQKVEAANPNAICGASTGVGRRTVREILSLPHGFRVPIFQRRYAWAEAQWGTLLHDAMRGGRHSLGRLTCTRVEDGGATRSEILDGQQRLTTTTILLASIRDGLSGRGTHDPLVGVIEGLLVRDRSGLAEWLGEHPGLGEQGLPEGAELPFVRLVPTHCDRGAYYRAILPSLVRGDDAPPIGQRPLRAKRYFDQKLSGLDHAALRKLCRSVLDGFHLLYFPIDCDPSSSSGGTDDDGTRDPMVVYERLAVRDATWCKPRRPTEYLSMGGADLIRNLLLGSFPDPSGAEAFYRDCWLPLERAQAEHGGSMEGLIQSFLEHQKRDGDQKEDDDDAVVAPGVIGGALYAEFEAWLEGFAAEEAAAGAQLVERAGQELRRYYGNHPQMGLASRVA